MNPTDLGPVLLAGVAAGCVLLVALWAFYDRRDRHLYDQTRRKVTFHCLKCNHLYSSVEREQVSPCPRCGHANARMRF